MREPHRTEATAASATLERVGEIPNARTAARSRFGRAFYVANLMEIFERLAWYGFFTVSSLYMTTAPARGGLGFSNAQRGVLQGIIPFFVYILPVITGALADRVGYRRMFIWAYLILAPAYFLLGEVRGFWPFFLVYLLVALGAAIFKPLVVGTVSRTTHDGNRGIGFGIFYLMVNVGGFLGPVLAGALRAISWKWVFVLSFSAIAFNLVLVLLFFRDRSLGTDDGSGRLRAALADAQHVLGNGRFALTVGALVFALMLAGGGWISWRGFYCFVLLWLGLQFLWDIYARGDSSAPWLVQKMRAGNVPFLVYLLVLSLFWTTYYQIYLTLPLYIRDYVDTGDLVRMADQLSAALSNFLAHVDVAALNATLPDLAEKYAAAPTAETLRAARSALAELQVLVPAPVVTEGLRQIAAGASVPDLARAWAAGYRQVNPEYIVALDFLSIVLFQYFVSAAAARIRVFVVLIGGTLLIALSYLLGGFAHTLPLAGTATAAMVVLFAFGEMLASPKSQEYVAAVAPPRSSALFMGYYFVSTALGLLFAGILSGWAYQVFAIERDAPLMMWVVFGAVGVAAALALLLFNVFLAHRFVGLSAVSTGNLSQS